MTRVAAKFTFFRRLVRFRLSTLRKWPTLQQSPSQLLLYVSGVSFGPRTPLRRLPLNISLTFLMQQRLEARKHEAPKAVSFVGRCIAYFLFKTSAAPIYSCSQRSSSPNLKVRRGVESGLRILLTRGMYSLGVHGAPPPIVQQRWLGQRQRRPR